MTHVTQCILGGLCLLAFVAACIAPACQRWLDRIEGDNDDNDDYPLGVV